MILANKIILLRKRFGWSQEDLAEKMDVSRQSVSKWESASSIPDLNKIILLAEIFGVSTDYLIKDEIEEVEGIGEDKEPGVRRISLEDAENFIKIKIEKSRLISVGVMLCVYSVIPLFFLQALSEGEQFSLDSNVAAGIGVVLLLLAVSAGISFFLRSSRFNSSFIDLENENFELAYGVKSVFKERLVEYNHFYIKRLSLSIFMIIGSVIPLLLVSLLSSSESDMALILMLVLMFVIIGIALYLMIPCVTENSVYNLIVGEGDFSPGKREETRRAEKLGAVYWPLVTAVYLGWSLWTMDWHITWIVWAVAGIAFAALLGLSSLFVSRDNK